jgi:hypothetical protein
MSEPQQPNQPQQPQPIGPPPPGPPPQQPPPTELVPPAKPKRFGLALALPAVLAAVVALLAGIGIGAWGGSGWRDGDTTTAEPARTVTVTETVEAPVEGGGAPTVEPSTTPTETTYNPKPKDFKVGIRILKKTCHGELGCDVSFRIVPSYVGSQSFPAEGKTEVTYEVTGGTDPITNTFEIDGEGTVTFDEEESVEIASSSTKLVATVTAVSYNEFG